MLRIYSQESSFIIIVITLITLLLRFLKLSRTGDIKSAITAVWRVIPNDQYSVAYI